MEDPMYHLIKKLFSQSKSRINRRHIQSDELQSNNRELKIPNHIQGIRKMLEDTFEDSNDLVLREIFLGENHSIPVLIAFINGMVNEQLLNSDIIKPLMRKSNFEQSNFLFKKNTLFHLLSNNLISSCVIDEINVFEDSIHAILAGSTVVFMHGEERALRVGLIGGAKRNVEEPVTESVVRGPREGFTESIRTNTALLRRKIRNPNLRFVSFLIGEQTKTEISICYIKGITNKELIVEVKNRLSKIQTDSILESGYIEEFIEDASFSLFPTVGNSEKPDIIASKILEGRIAILCDGTPFALTVPHLFVEVLQASEDYYSRWIYSFMVRFVRLMAFFISTMTPAYYVALLSFHQDVIPFKLLLTMSSSRQGIPFSSFFEALLMIFTFELLREAGIRMPRPIGQAISIVGALVIGDAAVRAGLVSIPMVVVIAITAISSFIIPQLAGTLLIMRLLILLAANIVGIFGIIISSVIILIHMCSLKSFGVPYLSPLTPLEPDDLKDTFIRFPLWALLTKPNILVKDHQIKTRPNTNNSKK